MSEKNETLVGTSTVDGCITSLPGQQRLAIWQITSPRTHIITSASEVTETTERKQMWLVVYVSVGIRQHIVSFYFFSISTYCLFFIFLEKRIVEIRIMHTSELHLSSYYYLSNCCLFTLVSLENNTEFSFPSFNTVLNSFFGLLCATNKNHILSSNHAILHLSSRSCLLQCSPCYPYLHFELSIGSSAWPACNYNPIAVRLTTSLFAASRSCTTHEDDRAKFSQKSR